VGVQEARLDALFVPIIGFQDPNKPVAAQPKHMDAAASK